MKYEKTANLLGNIPDTVPNFITKTWIKVHDSSGNVIDRYKPDKQIRFKKSMLQSDLCDYSNAYIVVERTITVTIPNNDAYDI